MAGNVLSGALMVAFQENVPVIAVIIAVLNPAVAWEVLVAMFHPMDLLFYGIALYEGYRFSFRQITEEELMTAVKTP